MKLTHFLALLGAVLILNVVWLFAQGEAQVNTLLPNPGQTNRAPKIEWIGHPMVSDNDSRFPRQSWLPEYQIGFREDGVVVWRKVKTAQ